jgi:hypothetical protein
LDNSEKTLIKPTLEERYVAVEQIDGTWSVIDSYTGIPASFNEETLVQLTKHQAQRLAEIFNRYHAGEPDPTIH